MGSRAAVIFVVLLLLCAGYVIFFHHDSNEVELPSQVLIRGQQWQVVEATMFNGIWYGYTDCISFVISLRRDIPKEDKAESLVHEIQHALTCKDGAVHNNMFNNDDVYHLGIHWDSPHFVAIIANNPQVIRYVERYGNKNDVTQLSVVPVP